MRVAALLVCAVALTPSVASAWSPFRSKNADVEKGNKLLEQGKAEDALKAYDRALGKLPDSTALQLNRGIASLEAGEFEHAKEALLKATHNPSDKAVHADAYYNLGLAFARQGEGASAEQQHEQASQFYREAADSFKRSLRARPGDRNTAWNLEVALQRIAEAEKKKQEQQEQQDQEQPDQEQQEGEEQQQDQEQPDQEQKQGEEQQQDHKQDQEDEKQEQDQEQQQGEEQEQKEALPQHLERFLDALEQDEESLPVHKARQRGRARQRTPQKDW